MPAATAVKARKQALCDNPVKTEALEIVPCKTPVVDGRCSNSSNHMVTKTGFCENGDCEGKAPKSIRTGKAKPTCTWWKLCQCSCHKTWDMMFKMSDEPRVLVDNSGYSPEHSGFKMPTPEERIAALVAEEARKPRVTVTVIEPELPDVMPMMLEKTFEQTSTGRSARGQLESWVNKHCGIWIVERAGGDETVCTPQYLSREIAKAEEVSPPSVGAIGAVFDRWAAMGYAAISKKPVRFEGYTPAGIREGLEGTKDRYRRTAKNAKSVAARGTLR